MEGKIVSKRLVKPSLPTPDHPRTCKLSIFDQLAPPAHVPLVFFYENFPVEGKLEQLVNSLSETLTRFYPLAGRFVKEGFYIDCNDDGALYVEAENDSDLSDFLNVAVKNVHLVNDLVPWADVGQTTSAPTPIVGIKVTIFKCGGIAVGTLVSHMISDGFTADKFIHDWSTSSSNLLGSINHEVAPNFSKLANFGVPSYFPARDLSVDIKDMTMPSSKMKQSKIATKRFVFTEKSMLALKAKVNDNANANVTKPTRVEVVTSTIWKALISLSSTSKPRDSTLYLHLNLRGRTGITGTPPLASSCGNFYLELPTRFKQGSESEGMELHNLVGSLRKSLRTTLTNCSKISSTDDLFSEVAKHVNGIREDKASDEVDVWLLSSLCRFPFYEVDFGWGKPEWVTTGGLPVEIIFLLDTKCGTGIEAIINLHETDMVQFEKDPDIIAFTS
ncbi:acetyl-CoA-benzylalcohol acetyltransferase-like [Heracleum sosnowskyi]|uniref:Acetyl-CoA-benzylalcohol acetyltransferase-like n=1 Tax=Heracleum sosnowskyi TaxID=360622 RepID=A0AAD8HVU6_9APIA|nr:acetyl-CoA-benzylalcohol acetyltransferase-like [Heracleum sosnowskyi]